VCLNADALPDFAHGRGIDLFDGRPTVGVWWWEVDEFPLEMRQAAELLDEIWVGSRYTAAALRPVLSRPVHVLNPPVVAPRPPASPSRRSLGVPEGFLFLFCFDARSVVERKNPVGLVNAFCRAFPHGEGPHLVLKMHTPDADVPRLEELRYLASERADIHLIERSLSPEEYGELMHACDAYVSLHRAEGFGLTMAEALAIGKPVIATGYTGNLDYMHEGNCYLVPYELVDVGPGSEPYPATARWAQPDL
jgi:glycosyltransferase involved in cell wall biosynthesis